MPYRSDYIDAATAALQALRNPTPEMVEAGLCKWHADSANTLEEEVFGIWQAMIHAALPGTERRGG